MSASCHDISPREKKVVTGSSSDVSILDASKRSQITVALVGNPNSGKTTLFNALTGLRHKVGNYPGVTVEKKEGTLTLPSGGRATLIDIPGLYSLTPRSPDETIAREVLLGLRGDTPRPDVVVNIVDASNLERNLYTTRQLLELGLNVVVVLTMTDLLAKDKRSVNIALLSERLGVPVLQVVASRKQGLPELIETVAAAASHSSSSATTRHTAPLSDLTEHDLDAATTLIEQRYAWVAEMTEGVITEESVSQDALQIDAVQKNSQSSNALKNNVSRSRSSNASRDEKIDKVVMHPVWGYAIFIVTMSVVFQAIFSWVQAPMDWIKSGIDAIGVVVGNLLPAGELRDVLQQGVLGGVGNTLVFLPQILLLFFFISLLEDTGYMARAAFLMDRLMSRVGLHGKSFIPLLSSFACAIPGILSTRTIGDRKARLITILVAPLMSCSARLPVYALMIGAFIPGKRVLGIGPITLMTLPGLVLLSMYLLGMVAAFSIAWLFHRTLIRGSAPAFVMELPPYRFPSLKTALSQMIERAGLFLRRAGTVILSVSVVLWALSTYPRHAELPQAERPQHSYVGQLGRAIEPAIAPLGFNWKMGIGMISSFVAREVFVSAMGTVYSVGDVESDHGQTDLRTRLQQDVDPRTGAHVYTPLVAIALMIYYVLAMQCISTIAVVRRETNGWKWPLFQIGYMTALAWIVTFVVYQGGKLFGLG